MNIDDARKALKDQSIEINKEINGLVDKCNAAQSHAEREKIFAETPFFKLPYPNIDPRSEEFRNYVLEIYSFITGKEYQVENEYNKVSILDPQAIERDFLMPFPFSTRNPAKIRLELESYANILSRLSQHDEKVLEMRASEGSLYELLLKCGLDAYALEINPKECEIKKKRARIFGKSDEHVLNGQFEDLQKLNTIKFDAIIFKASAHHCLYFESLMLSLNNYLSHKGRIIFSKEPICKSFFVPWGVRNDAETIYMMRTCGWLELGWDEEYWLETMLRCGYVVKPENPSGLIDNTAYPMCNGYHLAGIRFPRQYEDCFYPASDEYRLTKGGLVMLPVPKSCKTVRINVYSYHPSKMPVSIFSDAATLIMEIEPGTPYQIEVEHKELEKIIIDTPAWIPDQILANGDKRRVGIGISELFFDY